MNEREQVKEMIAASKRAKSLLDRRLLDLKGLVADEEERGMFEHIKEYPYFYGAMGSDGQPGILPSDQFVDTTDIDAVAGRGSFRDLSVGTVQLQEDAPFVWTHVAAMRDGDANLDGVQLGFIENGSGRVLFQAETLKTKGDGELLESEWFTTQREYAGAAPLSSVTLGLILSTPGAYAQGHGPCALFELPAETVLPVNGTVTVQARSTGSPRLYVALVGYKVFGD
jgi:hypothetical protein